jgi:hypothetical protein
VRRLLVALAALALAAGEARAAEPAAASIDTTVAAGPLVLRVHVSRTAQVFHVVDQLAAWSEFCHAQYARAVALSDDERALLAEHARVRAKLGWG